MFDGIFGFPQIPDGILDGILEILDGIFGISKAFEGFLGILDGILEILDGIFGIPKAPDGILEVILVVTPSEDEEVVASRGTSVKQLNFEA